MQCGKVVKMKVEKFLTVREVAEMLKIGQIAAYALFRRRDFPVTHVGKRKYVAESALTRWLQNGGTGGEALIKR